jgi:hypothetical protein
MTVVITKREDELICPNLEALTASLKSAIISLDWNEISSPKMEEVLRQLESLKTVILVRQAQRGN